MSKKDKKIPDNATPILAIGKLSPIETQFLGFDKGRDEFPHVSLKYIQTDYECFSQWKTEELKDFSSFINKIGQLSWTEIFKSGGSLGHKTGFAYTKHDDRKKLPKYDALDRISPDITFFELRVNQRVRVHGFRVVSTFFLVWLDRAHRVYKM